MFLIYSAHVAICVLVILVILFQDGKTGGLTGVADQASQQVFGAKGAGNFLTKLTTGLAIAFMFTSLTLALFHKTDDKGIADDFTPKDTTESTSISVPGETTTQETTPAVDPLGSGTEEAPTPDVIITEEDGTKRAGTLSESIKSIDIIKGDDIPKELLDMHKLDLENKEKKKAEEAKKKEGK